MMTSTDSEDRRGRTYVQSQWEAQPSSEKRKDRGAIIVADVAIDVGTRETTGISSTMQWRRRPPPKQELDHVIHFREVKNEGDGYMRTSEAVKE